MSGLPKQTLKVLLGGQQQDVVARLVPPGSSLVIENMFFDHQANLVKRYGSTALGSTTVPAGDTPPRSWALGKHQGALVRLGRQGQAPLMEWDPDHSKWLSAGSAQLVEGMLTSPGTHSLQAWGRGPTVSTIAKAAQQTTWGNHFDYHDIAVGQGFQCLTFVEGTDVSGAWTKLHQVLIDLSTGRQVMHVANGISNHIYFPHVAIVGTYACFVYNANGTLRIETFNLAAADPTVRVDNVSVAGEPTADHAIEIIVANNGLDLLIGYPGQSGQFRMATFRPANGITSTVNLKNQSSAAIGAGLCFAWAQNLDGAVWTNGIPSLVTADISAGFKAHTGWVQIDATNYAAGITQTVDGTDLPAGIAVCTAAGGTGSAVPLHAVYQSSNGTVPTIGHSLITNTGCTVDVNLLNARLVSKLFRDAGGATLYTAVTPFANQGTFYVMPVRDRPNLFPGTAALPAALCRAEVATAWQSKVNAHLPLPWVGTDGSVYVSVGVQYLAGATVVRSNLDIMRVQFRNGVETTLPAPVLGNPVEAIESMFVPGGQLNFWDGKIYGLAGFAYYPDAPVLTNNGASGAMTSGVDYYYCAVYCFIDAQGRKWRSAPSAVSTVHTGLTTTAVQVKVPYLQIVDRPDVFIEIYRGAPGISNYLTRLPVALPNNYDVAGSPSVTYVDLFSDVAIVTEEPVYTTGDVLANATTPGFTCIAAFDGRLWGVSADDPQALWYSDPLTPPGVQAFNTGAGMFFSQVLILDVRDDRGPITGLGVVDGRMCAFKHDAIYAIEGNGPDTRGFGGTYTVQRIAGSVGSDNPRSIVDAFDGIWFQSSSSRAGLWRLDRGTSLNYVGTGVRDLASLPVVGGVSLPEQSQIRWYTYDGATGGHVLVYDVITQQWTTFVSPVATTSAGCAIAWNGVGVWSCESASQLGNIMVETPNTYADGVDGFGQRIVGTWLSLADLEGYQRVYEYQGNGATIADHLLRVNLYRDLLDSDFAFAGHDYNMLASSQPRWDWELRFPMKLSAVKVEIIGGQKQDGSPTAGFAASAYAIVYGIKNGLQPTPWGHRLT
jgi:hypothetical protein